MGFKNVVGYKEETKELEQLASLLKNREELYKVGGELPKGLLLLGPNGVAKTQLANGFIKKTGFKAFSIDYCEVEDDDQFKTYIAEKFAAAIKNTPSIIFIDEIDKLVGQDDRFFMGGEFDRSNFLLSVINKYMDVKDFFVLIVGNRRLSLDASLIRSGRIDRTINIELPEEDDRRAIFEYYLKGKTIDSNVSINELASVTASASGADIKNIVNSALIKTVVAKTSSISKKQLLDSYYDIVFKNTKKKDKLNEQSRLVIATHESSHSVVACVLEKKLPAYITIETRKNVRGFVNTRHSDKEAMALDQILDKAVIALAGREGELQFFDKAYEGSINDLGGAKSIITYLVTKEGYCGLDYISDMADEEAPVFLPNSASGSFSRTDLKIKELLEKCHDKCVSIIKEYKELIEIIRDRLFKDNVLLSDEINEIITKYENKHNCTIINRDDDIFVNHSEFNEQSVMNNEVQDDEQ